MNNKVKAGLAAGAAALLIAGGGTSYALWSDTSKVTGATISSGNLDVAMVGDMDWTDVSNAASPHAIDDITTWRIVPGDTITGVQGVSIGLEGDNLNAAVNLYRNGVRLGQPGFFTNGALESTGAAGTPGLHITVSLAHADGSPVSDVPVNASGDLLFQASSVGQGSGTDDAGIPIIMATTASAADASPELLVKVTATFDASTSNQDRQQAVADLNTMSVQVSQYRP